MARDLMKEVQICKDMLQAIGLKVPTVEYKLNGRYKKVYGRCTVYNATGRITIQIKKSLMEESYPVDFLHSTIIHEMIHAIDHNKHKHSGEWLEMAELVNDCYSNITIQQYCTIEELQACHDKHTFVMECKECGFRFNRISYKAPKWFAHPQKYKCTCSCNLGNAIRYKDGVKVG